MITDDLIEYIQTQRRKNKADEDIKIRLVNAGWHTEDVDEAFRKLTPTQGPSPVVPPQSTISSQPYTVVQNSIVEPQQPTVSLETVQPASAPETLSIAVGMQEIEKPDLIPTLEIKKEEVVYTPYSQTSIRPVAVPPATLPIAPQPIIESTLPKIVRDISTPRVVPTGTTMPIQEPTVIAPTPAPRIPTVQLENPPIIPLTPKAPFVVPSVPVEQIFEEPGYVIPEESVKKIPLESSTVSIPIEKPISRSQFSFQSPAQINPLFGTEELTPTLIPKPRPATPVESPAIQENSIPVSSVQVSVPPQPSIRTNSFSANMPASAVLSTYPRDIVASSPIPSLEVMKTRKNVARIILRIMFGVLIIGGIAVAVYLFKSGYLPIPFSIVKKDPKVALSTTATALRSFESYTATTKATISSPSFANITNGLVTGDRVTSNNTDSITVDTIGILHKNSLSQYTTTIQSSLVKNPIHTEVTYSNDAIFITIPNLTPVFGDKAPLPGIISIKPSELESLLSLLPSEHAEKIKTADVYHMLTNGVPPYVKNNLSASLATLVSRAHSTTKGEEVIEGVPTTHYELTFDRADVKEFLMSLLDTFVVTLTPEQKKHVDEAFGATTIDTMDVWVGTSDDMTHQYSFSLTTPLSKILNLEDKGIAGTMVKLTSQTTYSDFNIAPLVTQPTGSSVVTDFVKSNTDQDIKAALEAFKPLARSLYNAEGSFGTRANPTGSCTNPNPSSLYSPVGHTKGATTAVGAIASSMNSLLTLTNGSGSCFSSQTAWAAAFPSMSDPISSYCVDSTGVTKTLTTQLKGTTCK